MTTTDESTTTDDPTVAALPPTHPVITAIRAHHTELADGLSERVTAIITAVDEQSSHLEEARTALATYCEAELLPHAAAEEDTIYAAGAGLPTTGLLVEAMTGEHRVLRGLVDDVFTATGRAALAAAAGALSSMFRAHLVKENDLLLPALVDADVDLEMLVGRMHELLGPGTPSEHESIHVEPVAEGCGGDDCHCGH